MTKIKWQRPELIIMHRGRPEESVLEGCKYNSAPDNTGGIQTTIGHGCQASKEGSCQACKALGGGTGS